MTQGIDYVYLETHNFGKTVKFWMQLGFSLALDLGTSGRLEAPDSRAALFVEEVPEGQPLANQIFLRAGSAGELPGAPAEVAQAWHQSHWGTQLLELRDPDGRTVWLQHRP